MPSDETLLQNAADQNGNVLPARATETVGRVFILRMMAALSDHRLPRQRVP
ncbi:MULTISPECIES: hypothetical protein [unclassified Rhizobium]|uniref:hypothetical protein n=1 Tax=unclassified Rhizobium TaxID=2613769 RepID=UPI001ADBB719|nr:MULTISPECIES: hypothetical protein [unclassified Rhizobium]MBO9101745.1 hypothetical protein [Rhizobium sp. L58/93]QXZ87178.1 hypothetical protein J5287_21665 [Rhizobium sp. K1/93]QXZ92789.1 hypothetical protein J5280_19230 [Rhizobium sp. K15/93]